jgi:hypothetical protein
MWKIVTVFLLSGVSSALSIVVPDKVRPEKLTSQTCKININRDLTDPQPLLIHPGTTEFYYPTQTGGIIEIEKKWEYRAFLQRRLHF